MRDNHIIFYGVKSFSQSISKANQMIVEIGLGFSSEFQFHIMLYHIKSFGMIIQILFQQKDEII